MKNFYLAEINIAKRLAPMDDPIMQDFVNNVDNMNAIADKSEGFIWRLQEEDKDEAVVIFQDDSLIINMSVWETINALFNYTYKSGHIEVFKRKKEWFSKMKMVHMAFWYVPEDYKPTFKDAKARLDHKEKHGDTPFAFSFKAKFTIEDARNFKQLK